MHGLVLCRSKEVGDLMNLLGKRDDPPPASIFVSGHNSCGKSFTVNKVLNHLNIEHCIISCVEAYTPSLLFDPILERFTDGVNKATNSEELFESQCEDMFDFIEQLNLMSLENKNFMNQKRVIVLEEAECLREMEPNLLSAFLKLQKLTLLKRICVILVSTLPWEKFWPPTGLSCPHQIYFPQYTRDELEMILLLDCPWKYSPDFYQHYVNLFLSVFWRFCRDVRELQYKARVNFSKYCEPIESGDVDFRDNKQLWQYIAPHLKASLKVVYMRMEMNEVRKEETCAERVERETEVPDLSHGQPMSASAKIALCFDLPVVTKYLLIAAYIASHNSPKHDSKMFVKLSGRKKKRLEKKSKNSAAKSSLQIIGPRIFDMARLLAIFYAIVETKSQLSANLFSQLSTLVELQLVHLIEDEPLEKPKFKCAVGLDYIVVLSRTLNFCVTKYLVD